MRCLYACHCLASHTLLATDAALQLQEDIRKNEFVAEYTGELINHKEADRRGKAYDRDSNTYLFDLNDDWVIDAKHRGNKMRFANHRSVLSHKPACPFAPSLNLSITCLLGHPLKYSLTHSPSHPPTALLVPNLHLFHASVTITHV